ncbi:hypothetical protein PO909_031429, partial [Leuciscus waleckii]
LVLQERSSPVKGRVCVFSVRLTVGPHLKRPPSASAGTATTEQTESSQTCPAPVSHYHHHITVIVIIISIKLKRSVITSF